MATATKKAHSARAPVGVSEPAPGGEVAGGTLIAPLREVDVQALDAARTPSMTLADTQQQRMLERLRRAGDQPVAFAELHASGIDFPAAVVSELQLNGYAIDRVYERGRLVGVRLLEPEPPRAPPARRRRLRPWRQG
jgi:hypothetical protein